MTILAIDPGDKESAFVLYDGTIRDFGKIPNEEMVNKASRMDAAAMCIEQICSYGMPVGVEIFETVFWSGRFAQAFQGLVDRIPRLKVKQHLCHDSRAKDSNVRQALIDRFGGKEATKRGGVLHGVTKDVWSALALAVTWWETKR